MCSAAADSVIAEEEHTYVELAKWVMLVDEFSDRVRVGVRGYVCGSARVA